MLTVLPAKAGRIMTDFSADLSTDPPREPTRRTVWALTDDRPGNNAQILGVCDALGLEGWKVEEKAIRYTGWVRLPNSIRGASLTGITEESREALLALWPDVVVSAGRRAAPVARWIKKQSDKRTRLVQIMFPGKAGAKDFDLIAVPDHDGSTSVKAWPNVLSITGAPSRITPELLSKEAEHWRRRYDSLPRPYIVVIVGGATRARRFSTQRAFDLGERVGELAKSVGGSILLTTSPRTGHDAAEALMQVVPAPSAIHGWEPGMENPYFGFLGLADTIIVTGDSVSMCAEACATNKPVYIYAPPGTVSDKHARLHQQLFELEYARPLGDSEDATLDNWTHSSLNPASDIAAAVRALFTDEQG
jgi:uncharacterized protein